MDWIECKSVWALGPDFAEVFVGREAMDSFESSGEVVGYDGVGQMPLKMIVGVIEEAFDGGFLDGSVHAFDLAVGPGMVRLGESMFDDVAAADSVEGMASKAGGGSLAVPGEVCELDSIVGEHRMNTVRNSFGKRLEKRCGNPHVGFGHEFDHDVL